MFASSSKQPPTATTTTPGQLRYNLRSMGAPTLVHHQQQPPPLPQPLSKPSTPAAAMAVPSPRHQTGNSKMLGSPTPVGSSSGFVVGTPLAHPHHQNFLYQHHPPQQHVSPARGQSPVMAAGGDFHVAGRRRHPSGRTGRVVAGHLPRELQARANTNYAQNGYGYATTTTSDWPAAVFQPHPPTPKQAQPPAASAVNNNGNNAVAGKTAVSASATADQQQRPPLPQSPKPPVPALAAHNGWPVQPRTTPLLPPNAKNNPAVIGFIEGLKLVKQQHMQLLAAQRGLRGMPPPPAPGAPSYSTLLPVNHRQLQQAATAAAAAQPLAHPVKAVVAKENCFLYHMGAPAIGPRRPAPPPPPAPPQPQAGSLGWGGHDGCSCRCGWECPVGDDEDDDDDGGDDEDGGEDEPMEFNDENATTASGDSGYSGGGGRGLPAEAPGSSSSSGGRGRRGGQANGGRRRSSAATAGAADDDLIFAIEI